MRKNPIEYVTNHANRYRAQDAQTEKPPEPKPKAKRARKRKQAENE